MVKISTLAKSFRDPVEVYEAAAGNPEPLAQRIKSGEEMNDFERTTLAAFLRGELVAPKLGRGQKRLSYLLPTETEHIAQDKKNAVFMYHHFMREIERQTGTKHGAAAKVIAFVAERDGIDEEVLATAIRRSKKARKKPEATEIPAAVKCYHIWMHRTGKLANYPKPFCTLKWTVLKETMRSK